MNMIHRHCAAHYEILSAHTFHKQLKWHSRWLLLLLLLLLLKATKFHLFAVLLCERNRGVQKSFDSFPLQVQ